MDRPRPGLKYLPVDELDRSKMTFENFTVEDPAGEKLGKLEGFIIDINSARPYYVVVNTGGWFRSKHFLIPIGHVELDYESRKLIADVPKERVKRFPGFDLDIFPQLTQEDLDRMAEEIGRACCPDHVIEPTELLVSQLEVWAHYRTPTWWRSDFYRPERVDEDAKSLTGKDR
jgi:PRC-barrel domain protein